MNIGTIGTDYNVHKIWCFIVEQLRQVSYDARAVKSNLAKI